MHIYSIHDSKHELQIWKQGKFVYIGIPKNASITYTMLFREAGWESLAWSELEEIAPLEEWTYFAHIQNPHVRHTKGTVEYLFRFWDWRENFFGRRAHPDIIAEQLLEWMSDEKNGEAVSMMVQGVFDRYTMPITYLLRDAGIDPQKINWIPMDHPEYDTEFLTNDFLSRNKIPLRVSHDQRRYIATPAKRECYQIVDNMKLGSLVQAPTPFGPNDNYVRKFMPFVLGEDINLYAQVMKNYGVDVYELEDKTRDKQIADQQKEISEWYMVKTLGYKISGPDLTPLVEEEEEEVVDGQIRVSDIQPFIFNWKNQFEKTCAIEDSLKEIFGDVTVINSDEENTREGWIDLGDEAYFTMQFRQALELLESDKKVLMHCQGDTEFDNYEQLVEDAVKYFNLYEWGVYAPDVTNVWYTPENTDIEGIKYDEENLKMVACTDETVWFIHRDIIDDYYERGLDKVMTHENMKMGWGWDMIFNGISFLKSRPVLRDYSHQVQHAKGTNYNKTSARKELVKLLGNTQPDLRQCVSYIQGDRENLTRYFGEMKNYDESEEDLNPTTLDSFFDS